MKPACRLVLISAIPLFAIGEAAANTRDGSSTDVRRGSEFIIAQVRSAPRLTDSERQRAIDYFRDSRSEQLSHIDLSVSIGESVPRNVALYDLPEAIVAIVPAYRGFRYARSREKIYVIDPSNFTVVDVIPIVGGATAGLDLSDDELAIVSEMLGGAPADSMTPWRLGLGAELPEGIALHRFSDTLVARVPKHDRFRYARTGDELLIADPDDRSVVIIIPDSGR